MNKKELLEKLSAIADDGDINETILGLDEFKPKGLDYNAITVDDYKAILENNQAIKGYNQSSLDSAISKAVESYKTKKLPQLVEEEINKRNNKDLTPEQIELKELKAQMEQMKLDNARAVMKDKYTKVLGEKGLSLDLIDFALGKDDESTNANIEKLSNIISESVNNGVQARIKGNSYVPPKTENNIKGGAITWNDVVENPSLMAQYNEQQSK